MSDTLEIKLTSEDALVAYYEDDRVQYTLRDLSNGNEECADEALIPRVQAALPHLNDYEVHLEVMKIIAQVITWLEQVMPEAVEDNTPDFDAIAKERRMEMKGDAA